MKHDNRKRNRLIACLMCAVLAGSAFYCIPNVFATTVESELTDTKAYSEWKDIKPVNGNFEAGYAEKEVYGWHKTAIEANNTKSTEENVINSYLAANVLTTAEEDGNKVASLQKITGAGYVGVTSQETEVVGGETYRLSFDYRLMELSGTGNYYGVRLLVEELNADMETVLVGEKELYQYYGSDSIVSEEDIPTLGKKNEASVEFQPNEETKYIVIYLWFGVAKDRMATVYFDNVTLEAYEDLNGTFDNVTYIGDGGRADGEAGPAGWTIKGCHQNAYCYDSNDIDFYRNQYEATIEKQEDGNNILRYSLDSAAVTASGYVLIQSPYIALETTTFSLQYDRKIDYVSGTPSHQTKTAIWYFDANKQPISIDDSSVTVLDRADVTGDVEWTTLYSAEQTAPDNAVYVKIGFFAAQARANAAKYNLYFDNVVLKTYDTTLSNNWSPEGCKENGIPYSDYDIYKSYYGIRTVNEGKEHSEALQLYVAGDAIIGGVVFYSQPIRVNAGVEYTTSFDLKTENSYDYYYTIDDTTYYTNETTYEDAEGNTQSTTQINLYGASYVLRYKDAAGNILNDGKPTTTNVNRLKVNQDWTSYKNTFTPPEQAATVEVGLVIGTYKKNADLLDLMYTWDNIVFMETEEYEKYNTDSDLLFKLTEKGNADLDATGTVDVLDLVMMKKYAADSTLITDDNKDSVMGAADMNVNTLINNADIELLHWKLLGVDTEAKAALVQGYKFY